VINRPAEIDQEFECGRIGFAYVTSTDEETIRKWGPGVAPMWPNTLNVTLFGRALGEAAWTTLAHGQP